MSSQQQWQLMFGSEFSYHEETEDPPSQLASPAHAQSSPMGPPPTPGLSPQPYAFHQAAHWPAQVPASSGGVDISEFSQLVKPYDQGPFYIPPSHVGYGPTSPGTLHAHSLAGAAGSSPSEPISGYFAGLNVRGSGSVASASDSAYLSQQIALPNLQTPIKNEAEAGHAFPGDASQLLSPLAASDGRESVKSDTLSETPSRRRSSRGSRQKFEPYDCPVEGCRKHLKTSSEAKKHILQHDKPFKCKEKNCTRTEGFQTINDLDRHMCGVHKKLPKICFHCVACPPPQLGALRKLWPRRDNFKAHVTRKHPDCNLDQVMARSQLSPSQRDAITESGYASAPSQIDPSDNPAQESASPFDLELPPSQPEQGDYSSFLNGNHIIDFADSDGLLADLSLGRPEPLSGFYELHGADGDGLSVPDAVMPSLQQDSPADLMIPSDGCHNTPAIMISGCSQQQPHSHHSSKRKHCRDSLSSPSILTKTGDGRSREERIGSDRKWECPKCGKEKDRECDLTKHMKRHSRPYGCTHTTCTKRFGSRNDWKRHEDSQHHLREGWRCLEELPDGSKCRDYFYFHNDDDAKGHVESYHAHLLTHGEALKEILNRMHLGRNANHNFWCGFCNANIPVDNRGHKGRPVEQRFKHIGDHFDKNHKKIDEWICVDTNKPKGPTKEKAKIASRKVETHAPDEDSDLGESGIIDPLDHTPAHVGPAQLPPPANHDLGLHPSVRTYTRANKRRRLNDDYNYGNGDNDRNDNTNHYDDDAGGEADAEGVSDDDAQYHGGVRLDWGAELIT